MNKTSLETEPDCYTQRAALHLVGKNDKKKNLISFRVSGDKSISLSFSNGSKTEIFFMSTLFGVPKRSFHCKVSQEHLCVSES